MYKKDFLILSLILIIFLLIALLFTFVISSICKRKALNPTGLSANPNVVSTQH